MEMVVVVEGMRSMDLYDLGLWVPYLKSVGWSDGGMVGTDASWSVLKALGIEG